MLRDSFLLCLCFCFVIVVSVSNNSEYDILLVHVVFRHGDRTPLEIYPNDPYHRPDYWSEGLGELTAIGKQGHYELGKWLRKRYNDFLPRVYKKADIYVRSTDVDRTLMSAYCNLAGLYEPEGNENWNPDIKWTPIPVHTVPEVLDSVLSGNAPCPRYNSEYKKIKESEEYQILNLKHQKLFKYLSKYTGANVTNIFDVEKVYDTLLVEHLHNLTLPAWTKSVFPNPMKILADYTFMFPCSTPLLARLKIGQLLGEISKRMKIRILGDSNDIKKIYMYSAHDTTIANILKALNLFEPHCPPYLSTIIFELLKRRNRYFVTVQYRNSTTLPPYFMQLPDCERYCPLETFFALVTPLIPENWEEECVESDFVESLYEATVSKSFITTVCFSLLFIFFLVIVYRFLKNHRWKKSDFAYKSLQMDISS